MGIRPQQYVVFLVHLPTSPRRIVMVEFPSVEVAQSFYNSDEYQHAISVREHAAVGEFIVVQGI